jgi:hypothetical protein
MNVLDIVIFEWMCWIWMCIWMYYVLCVQCAYFVIPAVLVILFSIKKNYSQG